MLATEFSFVRTKLSAKEVFSALSDLYKANKGFATLISTRVAPSWAAGTLKLDVLPQHQRAVERWLSEFWGRNSGMPLDLARLQADIGKAELSEPKKAGTDGRKRRPRKLSPEARAKRAAQQRAAEARFWEEATAPRPIALIQKYDPHTGRKRWMQGAVNDLKKIARDHDDGVDLTSMVVTPWDLRPQVRDLPAQEIDLPYVDTLHVDRDASGDKSEGEWAHATPRSTTVRIGDVTMSLADVETDTALNAVLTADGALELEEAALDFDAAVERLAQSTHSSPWVLLDLGDGVYVRSRAWTETQTLNRPRAYAPKRMVKVTSGSYVPKERDYVDPTYALKGTWLHSSEEAWERAAQEDAGVAEALSEFRTERTAYEARRHELAVDDLSSRPSQEVPGAREILAMLLDDKRQRRLAKEDVPAWLEGDIAFYRGVVAKAKTARKTAETLGTRLGDPNGLSMLVVLMREELEALEVEAATSPKVRRGLMGEIARLRLLLQENA
jgi:hypothetical protein